MSPTDQRGYLMNGEQMISNERMAEIEEKARGEREAAKKRIKVGATYRHLGGYVDVIVTGFHEATGQVSWRQASGSRPGDSHRNLDCQDFLQAYELKQDKQPGQRRRI